MPFPVTNTVKLADLCNIASSACMIWAPAPHVGSTMAVSLNEPCESACMIFVPLVSMSIIFVSRVRAILPFRLNAVPCSVIITPTATFEGVTFKANHGLYA